MATNYQPHLFPSLNVDPKKLDEKQLELSMKLVFKILDSIQAEWEYYWPIPGYKCITHCLQAQYQETLEQLESMAKELEYRQISMR